MGDKQYTQKDRDDAFKILEMYADWNTGQKSIGYAFGGTKNDEDAIYDERRKLIKKSLEVLNAS